MASNTKSTGRKKPNRFLKMLPYIGIVLVAAALIVAVIMITSRPEEKQKAELPTALDVEDQTVQDGGDTELKLTQESDSSAVSELVERYFKAVNEADVSELEQIVRQDSEFSKDRLKKDGEYIEAYRNIKCYTIPGIVDKTYIVYVYYDIEFIGIKTLAPSLIRLYVCENSDGSLYIDKTAKDGEVSAYLQQVSSMEDVRSLVTDVNTKMQKAKAEDDELRAFVDMLDGKSEETEAESSSEAEKITENETRE